MERNHFCETVGISACADRSPRRVWLPVHPPSISSHWSLGQGLLGAGRTWSGAHLLSHGVIFPAPVAVRKLFPFVLLVQIFPESKYCVMRDQNLDKVKPGGFTICYLTCLFPWIRQDRVTSWSQWFKKNHKQNCGFRERGCRGTSVSDLYWDFSRLG